MKKLPLPVTIEPDGNGYCIVSYPLFKDCHSYGETVEEALGTIREVIDICREETGSGVRNKFVGFRELELSRMHKNRGEK